jgi:signal transduction histidine kinase
LVYPVRRGNEVGGQLALYRFDGSGFADWQMRIVGLLCEQAGLALANAAERRRTHEFADLRQRLETIGARLAGMETRERTVGMAAREARYLIGDEHAVLVYMLPIPEMGHLVLEQTSASSQYQTTAGDSCRERVSIPVSEALEPVLEGSDVVEIDQPNDVRYRFLAESTRRALLAPIRYRYGSVVEGLLVAESPRELPFGEWRREALRLIASQLAVHAARSRTLIEDYAAFIHHFKSPMYSLDTLLQEFDALQKHGTLSPALSALAQHVRATSEQFRAYLGAFGRLSDLNLQPIAISGIVDAPTATAQQLVGQRKLTVNYLGDCGSRLVKVDPGATKGVILELLFNAAGNDPEGHPIDVTCEVADSECTIRVKDFGHVISEEQRRRLFDLRTPLGRSDGMSSGIGLWMVRTVVERQGGTIRLEWPDVTPKAFVIAFPVIDEQP